MDVNVALLPEAPLAQQIAAASRQLLTLGNTLPLDPEAGPYPHLTLYLTGFEDDSVATIPVLLEGNLRHLAPPEISVEGVIVTPRGTVLLQVRKTPELDELHRWMLHKLNSFRMRARPQFWEERRHRLGPSEVARLDQLGFPHALEAWSPHFTIGKLPEDRIGDAKALLGDIHMQGQADCIGVGTVGPHGSIPQILGRARFST